VIKAQNLQYPSTEKKKKKIQRLIVAYMMGDNLSETADC
jgi:hypothetical protein